MKEKEQEQEQELDLMRVISRDDDRQRESNALTVPYHSITVANNVLSSSLPSRPECNPV